MKPKGFAYFYSVVCTLLVALLLAAPSWTEEPFAKLVGDVKVGDVQKADVLQVPFILWGGDVATFHANGGLDTQAGSIFQKQGLKLKLKPGDDFVAQVKEYLEGKSPFLRGTFSMIGLASEVLGKDPRTKPVIFLQLTWSAGDHLVARPNCKTLSDLKGKAIALQKYGPHVGMLDDVLHTAKLKWSDIKVVWTDDITGPKGPAERFRKDDKVDACFVITPDMTDLTGGLDKKGDGTKGTVKDARVLVSTSEMKRSIADVYACRKDFFDANKEVVEKFAAGYLKGCEDLVDVRKKALAKDKDAAGKYKAILKMTQDIYGKDNIKSEEDADGLIADAVFVGLPGNKSFFVTQGNLSGYDAKHKAALDLAVGQGYAGMRSELLKADFNYGKLKTVGGLATDPDAGSGGVSEVAVVPKGDVLENNTIYFFTINFAADQSTFDEAQYGQDFRDALEKGSLFGRAMIAVRGHADLTKVLKDFVDGGLSKGLLKRTGSPGKYQYFTKDGQKLELTDTKKIVELIDKEDFSTGTTDPKGLVKALLKLSNDRAEAVRDAVIKYANAKKIVLDKNQIKAVGVGIGEPLVPQPRKDDEAAANRRVEFRIIRLPSEQLDSKDFDF
jgi:ABC-type nitrate/sulfonate/bicarbonate transport system substrate-binding protein